ncbi:hypothetical protein VNO77_22847 [Canavalia gladiata]|uniref:Uncharacterized protein n=1 Tax=Canavalia gladiata TaxID=3824 RepID=A0AAN9Q8D0_CANGL
MFNEFDSFSVLRNGVGSTSNYITKTENLLVSSIINSIVTHPKKMSPLIRRDEKTRVKFNNLGGKWDGEGKINVNMKLSHTFSLIIIHIPFLHILLYAMHFIFP